MLFLMETHPARGRPAPLPQVFETTPCRGEEGEEIKGSPFEVEVIGLEVR